MSDIKITAMVKTSDGDIYSGELWKAGQQPITPPGRPGAAPPPPPAAPRDFEVGLTCAPAEYARWLGDFGDLAPALPRFTRVFSPPGHGLPEMTSQAIADLPRGVVPWISHKDPVHLDTVAAFWRALPNLPDGRLYRWTYHHEPAPAPAPDRTAYLRYWAELRQLAHDFPAVELVQIQSNYAMRWRPDTDWRDWIIPGVSIGWDCYPLAGFRYEPPESMFGLLHYAADACVAPSWGVPELGAEPRGDQNRALWLVDCVDYLKGAGASFVGLWAAQEVRDGKIYDYRPTDALTLGAFQELLS